MQKRTLIAAMAGLISATAIAAPGDVRLVPSTIKIFPGQNFALQVMVDSGGQKLGGYTLELAFDRNLLEMNTAVANGVDALATANVYNVENDKGSIKMTGLDVDGKGPGNMLHILTLNGKALDDAASGSATVNLKAVSLINEMADSIATPNGQGAVVTITSGPMLK